MVAHLVSMEIIISRENPYNAVFDQINAINRTVWYRDIKIYGAFDWESKSEIVDRYNINVPGISYAWPAKPREEGMSREEATKVLMFLDYVGYKHKRYKYE